MTIVVSTDPYVIVTDEVTGWSLTGGQSWPEHSVMPMTHPRACALEVFIVNDLLTREEFVFSLSVGFADKALRRDRGRKSLSEYAFMQSGEADALAAKLLRAWYVATFDTMPKITVRTRRDPNA